eukprot:GHVS01096807.1.p1 GENE.GHVS01096807.1~~GHVS01096807.1.p1  ORF type:complete len:346 (-),score=119.92 GHVS01096807.1:270-1307(-)
MQFVDSALFRSAACVFCAAIVSPIFLCSFNSSKPSFRSTSTPSGFSFLPSSSLSSSLSSSSLSSSSLSSSSLSSSSLSSSSLPSSLSCSSSSSILSSQINVGLPQSPWAVCTASTAATAAVEGLTSALSRWEEEEVGSPLVYVSFGSMHAIGMVPPMQEVLETLQIASDEVGGNKHIRFILHIPFTSFEYIQDILPVYELKQSVMVVTGLLDVVALLRHLSCTAIITHGSAGTLNLASRLPLLCLHLLIPRMFDQPRLAAAAAAQSRAPCCVLLEEVACLWDGGGGGGRAVRVGRLIAVQLLGAEMVWEKKETTTTTTTTTTEEEKEDGSEVAADVIIQAMRRDR